MRWQANCCFHWAFLSLFGDAELIEFKAQDGSVPVIQLRK